MEFDLTEGEMEDFPSVYLVGLFGKRETRGVLRRSSAISRS